MKMWGARFSGSVSEFAHEFGASVRFDKRLYKHDITGSIAHAEMLGRQNIISERDAREIAQKLKSLLDSEKEVDETCEDVHTFIERELGEVGKRLHTGRSRNDQVALALRMFCKDEIDEVNGLLRELLDLLRKLSHRHGNTIMPGFTHLQKAQPITLALHLSAYYEMFSRDLSRLSDCRSRTDAMPLGSGALAGTGFPVDREFVREKLGFSGVTANSLDAVSDRDFVLELLFCLSMVMLHLSRFCEEIILWATQEFGFITISDEYSTGSSIMPQKKNPDTAELIRGKSGRVFGNLVGLLTAMKSLPLAYNKDMQESHEALYDALDTVKPCLKIFTAMLETAQFNEENMYESARGGFSNATDVADWLVKRGVPFREAHAIIGELVNYAVSQGRKELGNLTLSEFRQFSDMFSEDVFKAISIEECLRVRGICEKAKQETS
jgi:argininosuccinate lyase